MFCGHSNFNQPIATYFPCGATAMLLLVINRFPSEMASDTQIYLFVDNFYNLFLIQLRNRWFKTSRRLCGVIDTEFVNVTLSIVIQAQFNLLQLWVWCTADSQIPCRASIIKLYIQIWEWSQSFCTTSFIIYTICLTVGTPFINTDQL